MDLKLTEYDLELENGDVSFVKGRDAIAQDVLMRLRTWLGESAYDRTAGTPYLQIIFQRGIAAATIENVISQIILQTPGVTSIDSFTIDSINNQSREMIASAVIQTIDGEINFAALDLASL